MRPTADLYRAQLAGLRSEIERLYGRFADAFNNVETDREQVAAIEREIHRLEAEEGDVFARLIEATRLVPRHEMDDFIRKMSAACEGTSSEGGSC